jgi:hypothetical protein
MFDPTLLMKKNEDTKTWSRNSFLSSLGLLGSISLLSTSCKEPVKEPIVYKGENQEAIIHNLLTRRSIR